MENGFAHWRRFRRMTATELASLTGFSISKVSRIEHGQQKVSVATLQLLARVFGTSASRLMDGALPVMPAICPHCSKPLDIEDEEPTSPPSDSAA